jgi:hypothetical protein
MSAFFGRLLSPHSASGVISMLSNLHSSSTAKISRRRVKPISYSPEALGWDLSRVRDAWEAYQETRERDAIYGYLTEVFELVQCWEAEGEAIGRARRAAKVQEIISGRLGEIEPFTALISCTADRRKADAKTRSKWSRALRYAAERKADRETLQQFMKRKGGINRCASRFARRARVGSR